MAMVVRNLHVLDKSHRISFDIYLPDYKNHNYLSILLITEVTILSLLTRVIAWFSNHTVCKRWLQGQYGEMVLPFYHISDDGFQEF
jgi:hypothetical protein